MILDDPRGVFGTQHVAPIICLAAGSGVAALIGRLRSVAKQQQALHLAGGLLAAVGLGCLLIDVLHPYRGDCDLWSRGIIRQVAAQCGPEDQIVVLNDEQQVDVVFRWELARFREAGGLLSWGATVNEEKMRASWKDRPSPIRARASGGRLVTS